MSEKEKLEQRDILNNALRESFFKMLEIKKKLGQSVVTSDSNGNPMVISAEEAELLAYND